ncbi:nitrite reductase small subunit NirD [Kitasatospora camelliae]|uniref:Nitrite reductase small subunit NirD n=1 Tax=Kitasatospora camelliae TaxID=3156397 RepID=A0AAU8JUM5_9ACTN
MTTLAAVETAAALGTADVGTAAAPGTAAGSAGAGTRVEVRAGRSWSPVCDLDLLAPGRGVAALLPDGRQAALFRDAADRLYAVSNRDPFTGAYVLSRGLVGSTAEGRVYVASPLLKQRFDLATGECLDDEAVRIDVHPVRLG